MEVLTAVIGDVLRARYELTGLLSESAIFQSFSARDRVMGREVCVRLLKAPFAAEATFVQRLGEAVRSNVNVHHPAIEPLSELDTDGEVVFLVGELTRAPLLEDRIRKLAPFSVPVSVATVISICEALEALHRTGKSHGDIGGHTIAALPDGGARIQLTGIWEAYSASATAGGAVLPGMAPYLAPEVSKGAMPSPAADVYAVGILLFRLLTGRMPYNADTPVALAMRHVDTPTPSVRNLNPAVPLVLDEITKKAMAKEPSERYPNAGEFLSDLRMLQDALRFGRPLTWPIRSDSPRKVGKNVATTAPQPVAPRMTAIRGDGEENKDPVKKAKRDRDVPVWMLVTMAFCFAVLASLVGVWMLFNLNKPKLVQVPNLKGLSVTEARSMLEKLKLDMRVTGREVNEKIAADLVLDMSPSSGERVREGGRVGVTLSAGSRFVIVPNLKGLTVDEARSRLGSLNLSLEQDPRPIPSPEFAEGKIALQEPKAEQKVERTSTIRVTVSSGAGRREGPTVDTPPVTLYVYNLRVRLSDLTQEVVVRIEMEDDNGPQTIYEQSRRPNDLIEISQNSESATATFRIYYDGELVKSVSQNANPGTP